MNQEYWLTQPLKLTSSSKTNSHNTSEQHVEASRTHVSLEIVYKRQDLTQTEHSQRCHVLRGLHWSKPYEGDLHGEDGAHTVRLK